MNNQVGQAGVPARNRVTKVQGQGVGNAAQVGGIGVGVAGQAQSTVHHLVIRNVVQVFMFLNGLLLSKYWFVALHMQVIPETYQMFIGVLLNTFSVHGSWSSYDPWNNCPVSCGGTTNNQYRSRYCNKPQPSCGGSTCSGTSKQYQICNSSPCPVDGQWGEWSSYGSCPVTCGSGAHSRYRTCNNPSPANGGASCKGLDTEYTMCWNGECPVNGGWSEWSKFSACPVTCGGGTNTRTRTCDNPTPAHRGNDCMGAMFENGDCNTQDCPDYCESKPCENGASCANIHYGYKCTCVEGFQGNNCEIG
ncbi:HMCN [Mytilus coruscus]|uniref:HMCN n=1 Tax=Mytilus coruscus TaxID=42192 RepID=A0A6J8EA81_MYTCO|nr:HMCN [Mytilus coruscus]